MMGRVLRTRNKDTASTESSDTSQSSNASSTKRCQTVLTQNSCNVKTRNKRKRLNNVDSSSSESSETISRVVKNKIALNSTSVDQENIANVSVKTANIHDGDNCSDIKTSSKKEEERSVLLDKTNSILKNEIFGSHSKANNKVHFSSMDRIKRITQRRISDFFHKSEFDSHHDGSKSPRSCQREHRKRILECICHPEDNPDGKEVCGDNCINKKPLNNGKHHIPVYKVPVVNGNESFHLTPPQVKDKYALYDFEVDENEPVVITKKRRPFKAYKRRKRICKVDDNIKTKDAIEVPQRTMALRNDRQGINGRIDYNEHNDNSPLNVTDVYDPHSSNSNKNRAIINNNHVRNRPLKSRCIVESATNGNTVSDKIGNKENIPSRIDRMKTVNSTCCTRTHLQNLQEVPRKVVDTVNNIAVSHNGHNSNASTSVYTLESVAISERRQNICENNNIHESSNVMKLDGSVVKSSTKSDIRTNNTRKVLQTSVLSNGDKDSEIPNLNTNVSCSLNCTPVSSLSSHSLMPEYSRIDEGIQVGPIYTSSSINCSDAEYTNNFIRGITASTPCRSMSSPARINRRNYHVRLSGGESSKGFTERLLEQSNDEQDDGDFFGFDDNQIHEELLTYAHLNHEKPAEQPVDNEPVQKITVNEVINLLRQDVYGKKKSTKVKNKAIFEKIFDNSKDINSSNNEETLNSTADFSSPGQPTMDKYVNIANKERKKVNFEEETNESFTKPPRRSYTCITPRRVKRMDYRDGDASSEEEVEIVTKKPPKKHKVSKKEEKEMERLAALMNSQFQEIDKFSLVVE